MISKYDVINSLVLTYSFGKVVKFNEFVNWDEVYKEMVSQSISGLAASYFEKTVFPPLPVGEIWKNSILKQIVTYYRMLEEQKKLVSLLNTHSISFVIIKGTAASVNYPRPELRAYGDIDFYVKKEQFSQAFDLLKDNGYSLAEPYDETFHQAEFHKNGVVFELHNRISGVDGNDEDLRIFFDKGLEYRIDATVDDCTFPMFSPEYNGMVLLLHIKHHMLGGLGFRQIIDWMLFVDKYIDDENWNKTYKSLFEQRNLLKLSCIVTKVCQKNFGLNPELKWCTVASDKVCDEFYEHISHMGNFGNKASEYFDSGKGENNNIILVSGTRDVFVLLQRNGLLNWKLCTKYRFLRPFAWLYQLLQYVKMMGFKACMQRLKRALKENNKK